MTATGIADGRDRDTPEEADEEASLVTRAEAAAEAELRGDRGGILGAVGAAPLMRLNRTRRVPDRWSFYYVPPPQTAI